MVLDSVSLMALLLMYILYRIKGYFAIMVAFTGEDV